MIVASLACLASFVYSPAWCPAKPRVARGLQNMAANLDVSTLRIGENPLEKFENSLRVSLDKLEGNQVSAKSQKNVFILNFSIIPFDHCLLEKSEVESERTCGESHSCVSNYGGP